MAQKLITKAIETAFAKQGDTSELESKDIKIVAKFFDPMGAGTWYVYDRDPDCHDRLWAFCNLGDSSCAECGTVSLSELEEIRLPLGMKIERDIHFDSLSISLQDVIDKIKNGGHV